MGNFPDTDIDVILLGGRSLESRLTVQTQRSKGFSLQNISNPPYPMMHFWKCKFASFQAEKEEEECNCAENEECYHGECIGKEGYFNPIDGNVAIWSVNIPLSISKNTNNASRINVSRSERIVLIDVDIIVKKTNRQCFICVSLSSQHCDHWWRISLSIWEQTTLNHCRFVEETNLPEVCVGGRK